MNRTAISFSTHNDVLEYLNKELALSFNINENMSILEMCPNLLDHLRSFYERSDHYKSLSVNELIYHIKCLIRIFLSIMATTYQKEQVSIKIKMKNDEEFKFQKKLEYYNKKKWWKMLQSIN